MGKKKFWYYLINDRDGITQSASLGPLQNDLHEGWHYAISKVNLDIPQKANGSDTPAITPSKSIRILYEIWLITWEYSLT